MQSKHLFVSRLKLGLLGLSLMALGAVTALGQTSAPPPVPAKPATPAQPAAAKAGTSMETGSAKTPPDKVVMRVDDKPVTAGDMEALLGSLPVALQREAAAQGMKTVGDQYATLLALYNRAVAQGLDQTPEFKQKLALQRVEWLANDEYQKLSSQIQVTPDEIGDYYAKHQSEFEEVLVRQVSVRKKVAGPRGDSPGLPAADARARTEDIHKALAAGQDPAKVAEQYKLPNVVFFDPGPRPFRRGQLAGAMDKTAWTLKDGEVSDIQDNPMNYYFLQVVKHQQPTKEDAAHEIESKIKEQKFDEAVENLKKQANIWLDPVYFAPPKPPTPAPQAKAEPSSMAKPQPEAQKP